MTIPHFYESIPGWFNFQDIYAEQVARARDGAVFVEVGSWLGRSTAFMAVEIANSGKKIAFYAVDTWKGSPAPQYQSIVREHGGSVYEAFRANMQRGGVDHVVCPLVMTSVDATKAFQDGSVDFVFLDGAHDFHSVSADVRAWIPKVSDYCMIAGHDANCPGLMNAVKQWIPGKRIDYSGTSWLSWEEEWARDAASTDNAGVFDEALEEWRFVDYQRRQHLIGRTYQIGSRDTPPTPPDRYVAKWGGPPGAETFDFPYGVTTLDW